MDRRERFSEAVEQFRSAFEGMQSDIWTSLPARVQSVDLASQSCVLQPGLMAQLTGKEGETSWVEIPVLLDVPIQFPGGGGFTLTFPIAAGDEGIVVFAARCIDNWWVQAGEAGKSGYARSQAELRMHSLSDAFFIPGIRNKTRSLPSISATDVQLRNDAGSSFYSIKPNGDLVVQTTGNLTANVIGNLDAEVSGDATVNAFGAVHLEGNTISLQAISSISLVAATALTISAPAMAITGAVSITGSLSVNGKDFTTHEHLPGTYHTGTSTAVTGNSGGPV